MKENSGLPAGEDGVRASEAERQASVEALSAHAGTQRLSLQEFENRAASAATAQFRGELRELFRDLPEPHPRFAAAELAARFDQAPARHDDRGALRAVAYGAFPAAGVIAFVAAVLTGWWVLLLVLPPIGYLAAELAKKSSRRPLPPGSAPMSN